MGKGRGKRRGCEVKRGADHQPSYEQGPSATRMNLDKAVEHRVQGGRAALFDEVRSMGYGGRVLLH